MGAALAMPVRVAMLYSSTRAGYRLLAFFSSFIQASAFFMMGWRARLAFRKTPACGISRAITGQWLARHISEAWYRQTVLVILFVVGYAVQSA
jgi:hypothetical protein